ncbi:biotin--[Clostridium sp. D2Q-11]|uniref:Bifunctional ligase/repressor BirA n=1 Tax=Anaeromonas frigoriresistens TaxID=2683708 RepID=A0A942Z5L4_9FIRM|nr:biotin--[acetyl-CoA-carboxylase] ligase [Anaeromonas frigoriresistens]
MREKIIDILKDNKESFISGQEISDRLKVSRTAVWKYISKLKEDGYIIQSVSRKGYRLLQSPDILEPNLIDEELNTEYIGRNIIHYSSVDSTNMEAKKIALEVEEGTTIISEEQLKGKGRLGRNWTSPKGKGIWMSIILKPDISPTEASKVTQIGAASVSKAIEEIGIKNKIKWPNDIVIKGKKTCGILTEMSGEINRVNYIVVGIGINVNLEEGDFPEDLREVGTSLRIEKKQVIDRVNLVSNVINNFEYLYKDFINTRSIKKSIDICKESSALLHKRVRVIKGDNIEEAVAIDINDDGHLIVKYDDGNIKEIISGEISIRGIKGYI